MEKREHAQLLLDCMILIGLIGEDEPDHYMIQTIAAKVRPRLEQALIELAPDENL